jgi:hypothetical protein
VLEWQRVEAEAGTEVEAEAEVEVGAEASDY